MSRPSDFDRLAELFHEAIDSTPTSLTALLTDLRAESAELADELESLLRAEPGAARVIERLHAGVPALDGGAPTGERADLISRRLSHYQVERLLGRGGMGDVYLATDLALEREVALKVVRPDRADSVPGFRAEIEATAKLQHPAIATFYEVAEDDDVLFLAMEFVPGRTLREYLHSTRPEVSWTLGTAVTLLEAVSHAHTVGIVHRDIKPENVVVTPDGEPRLLDFGIAEALGGATEPEAGGPQALVGTPGYLAPEQIAGGVADHRADLFSIGAVLYEALTGTRAFPGDSVAARLSATSTIEPPPPGIPPYGEALDAVVGRSLAKDPDERYSTAGEMIEALRSLVQDPGERTGTDSVAVLDFESVAGDDGAWLADGVTRTLRAALADADEVVAVGEGAIRSAVRRIGLERTDPAVLGRALACRWVVSGSCGTEGDHVAIAVSVHESATGSIVHTESFSGAPEATLEVQRRVAERVLEAVGRTMGRSEARAPRVRAFELVARSREPLRGGGKGGHRRARALLEEAIAIDPEYADGHALLAQTASMEFIFEGRAELLAESVAHAQRALALVPGHHTALTWLLYARCRQGAMDEAMTLAEQLSAAAPNDHNGPYFQGALLGAAGNHEAAVVALRRAVELAPRHGMSWLGLGWAHLEKGAFRPARWCLTRAHELELDDDAEFRTGGSGALLAECFRREGALAEALRTAKEAITRAEASDFVYRDTFRAMALCSLGRTALDSGDPIAARAAFTQAAQQLEGRPRALGGGFVLVQALAGMARAAPAEGDDGEAWLTRAARLMEERAGYDFEPTFGAADGVALFELSRAHHARGDIEAARELLVRAAAEGSGEARLAVGS